MSRVVLSPRQQEVIDLMRQGWKLQYTIAGGYRLAKSKTPSQKIQTKTVESLLKADLLGSVVIEYFYLNPPPPRFARQ